MTSSEIISTWKTNPQIREEFLNDISRYEAYLKAEENGQIRMVRTPIIK